MRARTSITLLLVIALQPLRAAQDRAGDATLEYRVKAAYLLNFTRFVEWPADPNDTGPITICVAGANPFGDALNETLRGEQVNGRPVRSRVIRDSERCHVLFIPRGVRPDGFLRDVRNRPVLTVGESADFLNAGGLVNFVIEERKVRFEIDHEGAARAKLKISSRLLRLARSGPTLNDDSPPRPRR